MARTPKNVPDGHAPLSDRIIDRLKDNAFVAAAIVFATVVGGILSFWNDLPESWRHYAESLVGMAQPQKPELGSALVTPACRASEPRRRFEGVNEGAKGRVRGGT